MYFDEDNTINYDDGPLAHEVEPERRHSVELDCLDGRTARYTMTERTKRSVVLRRCIEFFAGFEPPMDSVETDRLFEEALVNLARPSAADYDGAAAFLKTFKAGPTLGEVRSRYTVEGDYFDETHFTLVAVLDVRVEASLEQVRKTLWTRYLERMANDPKTAAVECIHRINEDELVYKLKRRNYRYERAAKREMTAERRVTDFVFGPPPSPPPRPVETRACESVCYARIASQYHPVERFVQKECVRSPPPPLPPLTFDPRKPSPVGTRSTATRRR